MYDGSPISEKSSLWPYAFFALGAPLISIPSSAYSNLEAKLKAKVADLSSDVNGLMFVSGNCAGRIKDFHDLSFSFDGSSYFTVPPLYYLIDIHQQVKGDLCLVGVQPLSDDGSYVLGEPFLRAWYTIYDFENNRVGVALSHDSTAAKVTPFPTWALVLIIISSVIAVIAGMAYFFYRRR